MTARALLAVLAGSGLLACATAGPRSAAPVRKTVADAAAAGGWDWQLPPGFPAPRVPPDNPMSAVKVELGRRLFFDPRLSGPGTFACATCHRPEHAFTDAKPRAIGVTGERHPRGAMSLANVAYAVTLTWADPGLTALEDQVLVPMLGEDPVEMGVAGREREVLARLADDKAYRRLFRAAFPGSASPDTESEPPGEPYTLANVARAIAAFERTLISGDSAYDRYVWRDDQAALSPVARRGMELFFSDRLACSQCHAGFTFSGPSRWQGGDDEAPVFHNTGLYDLRDARGRRGAYPADNPGVFGHTGRRRDIGRFRAPTLRNVALTAPYMHDGSIATLSGVIDHYAAGGRTESRRKSALLRGFALGPGDQAALIAFLESLSDRSFVDDPRYRDPFAVRGAR